MNVLVKSLLHVLLVAVPIGCLVFTGIFDKAPTEDGLEHYAEQQSEFLFRFSYYIRYIPMPLNTYINFPYMAVGLFWIYKIYTASTRFPQIFNEAEVYMYYVFGWTAFLYGFVQLARILTQNHQIAILDQWYTLLIFAWLVPWLSQLIIGPNYMLSIMVVSISCLSYLMALIVPYGFEISLTFHIVIDIYKALKTAYVTNNPELYVVISKVILSCVGFVGLKVLDLHLPSINFIFNYISGHFLSKICDCLQFHYAFEFFYVHHICQVEKEQK